MAFTDRRHAPRWLAVPGHVEERTSRSSAETRPWLKPEWWLGHAFASRRRRRTLLTPPLREARKNVPRTASYPWGPPKRAMKVCALVLALCAGALSMPVGVEEGPRPVVPLVITDYSSVAKDAAPAAPVPAAAAAEPAVQQPVVPAAPAAAAAAAPAEGAVRTEQPAEPAKDAPLADNKPAPAAAAAEEDKLKRARGNSLSAARHSCDISRRTRYSTNIFNSSCPLQDANREYPACRDGAVFLQEAAVFLGLLSIQYTWKMDSRYLPNRQGHVN
ncbi:Protein of unknown function [Gryllus bimaculatus]|nr:Protein of unknown function [Gryllus bimaculatus]